MSRVSLDITSANSATVTVGELTIWFSYKTPIAFNAGGATVCRENDWSVTTGKHLNAIDGGNKKSRIPGEQFERQLAELTAGLFAAKAGV